MVRRQPFGDLGANVASVVGDRINQARRHPRSVGVHVAEWSDVAHVVDVGMKGRISRVVHEREGAHSEQHRPCGTRTTRS